MTASVVFGHQVILNFYGVPYVDIFIHNCKLIRKRRKYVSIVDSVCDLQVWVDMELRAKTNDMELDLKVLI